MSTHTNGHDLADIIISDVDLEGLAKKNGDEAYRMAKDEWGWSEERAQKWQKIWGQPVPPLEEYFR